MTISRLSDKMHEKNTHRLRAVGVLRKGEKNMLRIGIFTDAHYARDRVFGATRMSRLSLEKLRLIVPKAGGVDAWINLGDLVNATGNPEEDAANIRQITASLKGLNAPCFHVLGNHDCEAAKKAAFGQVEGGYAFDLKGIRFIALDANYTHDEISYDEAEWDWTDAWIPEGEIAWLRKTLAKTPGQAVVLCHQNLDPREGDPHVVGNARAVRQALEESGKVLCVLQGHCHRGCYGEYGGIPYYTFRALCEGRNVPFGVVEIEDGTVRIIEAQTSLADGLF